MLQNSYLKCLSPPFTFHSRPPPSYELAMMQKYGAGSSAAIAAARRRQKLFEECVSTELYLTPADTENDEDFGLNCRSYDPVYVAALRHSNLRPFLAPFNSCDREDKFVKKASRQAYMRRRRSLVEALNHSIEFPQSCSIENLATKANEISNISIDDSEIVNKWKDRPSSTHLSPSNRMLRRRPAAAANDKNSAKFPLSRLEDELVTYRPCPLQRTLANQQPQKRSRSQPLCQHRLAAANAEADCHTNDLAINAKYIDDSMDEYGGGNFAVDYGRLDYMGDACTSFGLNDTSVAAAAAAYPRRRKQVHRGHLSRADRFSIDSEAGNSSQDSGIRSSMHSNSSTATSTSSSSGIATGNNSSQKSTTSHPSSMLLVEAVWDHIAMLADELPFISGDIITVLDSTSNSGLWYGVCRDSSGWFPASYVRVKTSREIANRLSSNSFSSSTNSAEIDEDVAALIESVIDEEDENFPPKHSI
uniref:SH3 domain-containing protein n=1 Tax=Ditylenchus dipsaci TaxID=166011 RepID=A0A915D475_9BILA